MKRYNIVFHNTDLKFKIKHNIKTIVADTNQFRAIDFIKRVGKEMVIDAVIETFSYGIDNYYNVFLTRLRYNNLINFVSIIYFDI